MKRHFEGWYFKHQKDNNVISLIPGINIERDGTKHAFIQIITNDASFNINYNISEFYHEKHKKGCPNIKLAESYFSNRGIKALIRNNDVSVDGIIKYSNLSPIKYDIMGPFKFLPFMECKHGIISMKHKLSGYININGNLIDLEGGTGYIETDKGHSFPSNYLWTQCSGNIDNISFSISAAAASIPITRFSFKGCICVININNKEYRIATYLGCNILHYDNTSLIVKQGKYRLEVKLIKDNSHKLWAPDLGNMTRIIRESAACTVHYKFYINNDLIINVIDNCASFEFA